MSRPPRRLTKSDTQGSKKNPKRTRRRTVLDGEYDELSLRQMGVDLTSSFTGAMERRSSMSDVEGMVCRDSMNTFTSSCTSSTSQSPPPTTVIQSSPPIELWDDIKSVELWDDTPSSSQANQGNHSVDESNDVFEHEVIHKISNYTYRPPRRYNYLQYACLDWWDSTKLRRGTSILFVLAVIVVSAAWIGVAIPKEDATHHESSSSLSTDISSTTKRNDKNNLLPTSKYTPIRSNTKEPNYTPQQLLELTEQINLVCDESGIIHPEERHTCQQLCHTKMCCFEEDPYNCQDELCAVYMGCQVLYGDYINNNNVSPKSNEQLTTTSKLIQLTDEILGYCDEYAMDPQSEMGRECVAHCLDYMCCFDDNDGGGACEDEDIASLCEVFEGCEVLVGSDEVENVT